MKKLVNLLSLLTELLQLISYFILVRAGSKILHPDTAEIKVTRNKVKRLLEQRKRLHQKADQEHIEDKINEMVPKDKVEHFNDLLSKL